MNIQDLTIKGRKNLYSSMASSVGEKLFEMRKELIKQSLSDFENVAHRLEKVGFVRGIEFINDSKATNINSAWYALESMTKPVIWIVGGQDNGNDYSQLNELVRAKVKAIVCLGKDNRRVVMAFEDMVSQLMETKSAADAVKAAYLLGAPGDVVLFSPACASFDLFENYEDRGNQFKQAVSEL